MSEAEGTPMSNVGPLQDEPPATVVRQSCARCRHVMAVDFVVPRETWRLVAGRHWQHSILCVVCFAEIGDEKGIEWERAIEFRAESFFSLDARRAAMAKNVGCFDCGREYGNEHGFPDLLVPNWAWKIINPYTPGKDHEGGLLCPSCICGRLSRAGLSDVPFAVRSGALVHGDIDLNQEPPK